MVAKSLSNVFTCGSRSCWCGLAKPQRTSSAHPWSAVLAGRAGPRWHGPGLILGCISIAEFLSVNLHLPQVVPMFAGVYRPKLLLQASYIMHPSRSHLCYRQMCYDWDVWLVCSETVLSGKVSADCVLAYK